MKEKNSKVNPARKTHSKAHQLSKDMPYDYERTTKELVKYLDYHWSTQFGHDKELFQMIAQKAFTYGFFHLREKGRALSLKDTAALALSKAKLLMMDAWKQHQHALIVSSTDNFTEYTDERGEIPDVHPDEARHAVELWRQNRIDEDRRELGLYALKKLPSICQTARVSARDYAVFVTAYLYKQPPEAVACTHGITVNHVYGIVHKVIKKLREYGLAFLAAA